MFSNKDLRRLIVPLIFEQLLATTIGLADTIMVATCGEAAVSGISLVDSINFLFITMFAALATGGSVVSAQYLGKGDAEEATRSSNQLFYFSLLLSGVIAVAMLFLRGPILRTIYGRIEEQVMTNAMIYFLISAISYPFLAVYNSGAALFRAMGDSKTSMYTSFLMNGINVVGNALLIFVFHMGVTGAALATLFSRIVGCIYITCLLLNSSRTLHYENLMHIRINFSIIRKILYIGIPNGIENSIFQIGKIIVASLVSVLGTASITANAVTGNLCSIQCTPGTAVGMAMITVVSHCVGAQDYEQARKYIKKLLLIAYVCMWVATGLIISLHKPILGLYGLSEETYSLTVQCFFVHAVIATTFWPLAFVLPNALRAANDVKYTMYASISTLITIRLVLTWILINVFHLGVVAAWIAMAIDWIGRTVCFVLRLRGDRWTKKKLV